MTHVLVLGGTGKTGRRITRRLAAAGADVRAGARHPDAGPAEPGVRPVRFDWDDRTTWDPALADVEVAYLVPPALVVDHTAPVTAFVDALRAAGVRRAVFLSARGADASDDSPMRREELALGASGLGWSVLRPSWFMQNFTEGAFAGMVAEGTVALPVGEGANPMIDADDIGDVATRLLLDERFDGQGYDLSGPAALSFAQATKLVGEGLGRELRFVDADPEGWGGQMEAVGVPADYAALLGFLLGLVRAGADAHLSDGVQRVLGREPRSFEAWAAALPRTQERVAGR